jgi:Protein of unknown function (DUF3592)
MLVVSLIAALALWVVVVMTLVALGRVAAIVTLFGCAVSGAWLATHQDHNETGVLIGSLVVLAGVHVAAACMHIWHAEGSRSWPTAKGWVASAVVREQTDSDGDNEFRPEVSYMYEVDGRSYLNRAIAFVPRTFSRSSAVATARLALARGDEVDVYYDPTHPAVAVLQPGASRKVLFWSCLGAAQSLAAAAGSDLVFGSWTLLSCGAFLVATFKYARGPEAGTLDTSV